MEARALHSAVRRLRQVVAAPALPAGPDAELLRAFAIRRDAAAFEQLVRRHGPMVLGVCRRVMRDAADADDAFQATFLVLVRKAGSLRRPDRLAGWLYQVAYRTARKARALRLARARREGELFDVPAGEQPAEVVWRELRPIFDAELDRLPDRLRLPAVLCLLEGHSKGEAARSLGWPEGTLSCRLQRARERLRARLAARGLTLSAGALAAALFEEAGAAAVPDWLIESTLRGVWTPAAAAGVRTLADGVTQSMFLTKIKAVAAAALVVGAIGAGTGVALVPGAGPGAVLAGEPAKEGAPAPRVVGVVVPEDLARSIELVRRRMRQEEADAAWFGRRVQGQTDSTATTARFRLQMHQLDRERLAESVARGGATQAELDTVDRQLRYLEEAVRSIPARPPEELRLEEVTNRLVDLRSRAKFVDRMIRSGYMTEAELRKVRDEIAQVEKEEKQLVSAHSPTDPNQAIRRQELETLKGRLAWEEKMVAKGFLSEAQVKKTRLEVARAEAALAKGDAPRPPDPRRAAADEVIRKLEQIVEQTREGVRRKTIPDIELLNAEATLARYKFELLWPDDGRAAPSIPPSAEQRAAMEAVVKKLEEIVARTEEAVQKKIIPQQELLNAQLKLLEYKFKLAELSGPPNTTPPAAGPPTGKGETNVAAAERDLARAEELHKQKTISAAEVRRLRVDLDRLRAQAATARADYSEAARQLDAAVAEIEAHAADVRAGVERQANPRSELRMVEVGLAEARVEALRAHVRRQLAEIVTVREAELKEVRALADAKAISADELRQAERALADARARLAAER